MVNSLLKFAVVVLVAVCVCAAPHSRFSARQIHRRVSKEPSNGTFVPHELPCSYKIVQTEYLKQQGYEQNQVITYNTLGPYFKVTYDVSEAGFVEVVIIRPDIMIADPDSDKVYIEEFHCATLFLDKTENLLIEEGEGPNIRDEQLDWFVGSWQYDNYTTGSCWGEKCQIFYFYDAQDEIDVFIYANLDNFIIGLNASGENFLQVNRMEYLEESDLGDFILNKTEFDDCNDTRAYDRPIVKDPCKNNSLFDFKDIQQFQKASKFTLTGTALGLAVLVAIGVTVFLLF